MPRRAPRALDTAPEQEPVIDGPFQSLAYFYANVYVGTTAQKATVITDTGSTRLAFPCTGCTECGEHLNPKVDPTASSTMTAPQCGGSQCRYSVSYQEGSSIEGVLYEDLVWLGGEHSDYTYGQQYGTGYRYGCHTRETSECVEPHMCLHCFHNVL